ncbi:glutamine synthetase, partial [bacterium]|nr:glutamine synthetase [bacterium]
MSGHTQESIVKFVHDEQIEVIWHWFVDLEGHLKGFAITPNELERSLENGMQFDGSSISGFNPIEESDMVARPDLSTFVLLPSYDDSPKSVRFFCDIETPDGENYDRDPRSALKKVVKQAAEMGFKSYMGPEIEFFVFKGMDDPTPLDYGSYFTAPPVDQGNKLRTGIITALHSLGIRVEYHHHEVAPSQHEIDLQYTDALTMADSVMTAKLVIKELAQGQGAYASFMPKPMSGKNGSGMHTHQSLFRGNQNAFFDSD